VDTPEGRGTVTDIDLLRQRVKVRMEDSPETITWFSNSDIAVLRSGKAKKNDPPIPADLAPISGAGKRVRKEQSEERLSLEPIRFRYSTETVVEEPAEEPKAELPAEAEETPKTSRNRRRNRKEKATAASAEPAEKKEQPEKDKPKKQRPEKPKKPVEAAPAVEAPAPEAEVGEAAQPKKRRRPPFRRRKPKASGGESNNG
jgi:hypothetical protein